MQINGENYLAPVDLEVMNEIQARNRSMNASEILAEMEAAGTDLQIVILDACRDNPFAARGRSIGGHGLAPMNAGKGTFIAYATAPGQTADDNSSDRNGLFTKYLLETLKEPGLPLDAVFNQANGLVVQASKGRQVPWTASSVNGVFYFRPPVVQAEARSSPGMDEEAWQSIRDSKQPRVFQRFIEAYPDSRYVPIAKLRIEALSGRDETSGDASDAVDIANLRDQLTQGIRLERIGRAKDAFKKYSDAYERAREAIAFLPGGQRPSEALESVFVDLGYRYSWALVDVGRVSEGDEVQRVLETLIGSYDTASAPAGMLLSLIKFEQMERRWYAIHNKTDEAKKHAQRAVELAARVAPNAAGESAWLTFISVEVQHFFMDGPAKEDLLARSCAMADRMIAKNPADGPSVDAREYCLSDQAETARTKGDFNGQLARLEDIRKLETAALTNSPDDRYFLLTLAETENQLADLALRRGKEEERNEHRIAAQDYFVRALRGRTVFTEHPFDLRSMYANLKVIEFSNTEKQVAYYKDIAESVAATADAFPQARNMSFISADASTTLGDLLSQEARTRPVALTWFSNAIDGFNKAGVMDNLGTFSEDFSTYCRVWSEQAELHAKLGQPEQVLTDWKAMMNSCQAPLDKYPWDIYLRSNLLNTIAAAGQALVDTGRYSEAIPLLEYCSHWVHKTSTKTLARIYRDGLGGIPKNPAKAQELETLAAKQIITRYTIPTDFGGIKVPFYYYIRDWPSDYQYVGIDDQVIWLKQARGGVVAPEVVESFHKLMKIAKDNKVSFRELVEYALGQASDKTKSASKTDSPLGDKQNDAGGLSAVVRVLSQLRVDQ